MSSLLDHARIELHKAGFYDADADYGALVPNAVLPLIAVFSEQGHSGGSAALVVELFTKLASFQPLTPLTDDPNEWVHTGSEPYAWQNKRKSSCFSDDGGKTYFDLEEKQELRDGVYGRRIHHAKHATCDAAEVMPAQFAGPVPSSLDAECAETGYTPLSLRRLHDRIVALEQWRHDR